jgi:hypothetical protein
MIDPIRTSHRVAVVNRPIPGRRGGESRPFSFDAVFEMVGGSAVDPSKVTRAARVLHVNNVQVYRWASDGLSPNVADAIAVRLGRHPVELWSDWFSHAPDDEEVAAFEEQERLRAVWRAQRAARVARVTVPKEAA